MKHVDWFALVANFGEEEAERIASSSPEILAEVLARIEAEAEGKVLAEGKAK